MLITPLLKDATCSFAYFKAFTRCLNGFAYDPSAFASSGLGDKNILTVFVPVDFATQDPTLILSVGTDR